MSQQPQPQRVDFSEAVSTLSAMFPAVDVSVINRVLRRQKGHMEHSVSNLLAITAGETDTASSQPVYTLRQPVRRAAPQRQQRQQQQHQNPLRRGELLQDPVASVEALVQGLLQPGNTALRFLAPPSRFKQRVRPLSGNTVESQEEQDRLFAEMLQNQQFMRQLREEPHLFDGPEQKSTAPQSEQTEDGEQEEEEGEESLSSKWNRLGASARRKLAAVAASLSSSSGPDGEAGYVPVSFGDNEGDVEMQEF